MTKPLTAMLAAALLSGGAALAAVPDTARSGAAETHHAPFAGIQLADGCGNWSSSQRNAEEDCLTRSWGADPDWVRRGDPGSQNDDFASGRDRGFSAPQNEPKEEHENPPCFC